MGNIFKKRNLVDSFNPKKAFRTPQGDPLGIFKDEGGGGGGFPQANIPEFAMRKTTDFDQKNTNIKIGGPDASSAMNRRFDTFRQQAGNQANRAGSNAVSAINRKFSAMGTGNSGAAIKMQQQALNETEQQKNDVMQNINLQQDEAVSGLEKDQANLDFQQRVFNFDQASKMHALDLEERQQKIGAAESVYNAHVNAEINKPQKKGAIGGLLDGIL